MPWLDSVSTASSTVPGTVALSGDLAGISSSAAQPRVGRLTGETVGADRLVIVRTGAALAFSAAGTTTDCAQVGLLRFKSGDTAIAFRNPGGTDDYVGMTNNGGILYVGCSSGGTQQPTSTYINGSTRSAFMVGGSVALEANATQIICAVPLKLTSGTTAATGQIRAPNASNVIVARNAANSADIGLVAVDSSNQAYFGSINDGTLGATTTILIASSTLLFQANFATKMSIDTNYIAARLPIQLQNTTGNANVATTGDIRAQSNTTIISARNAANSANIAVLATDGANNITIGEQTNTPGAYLSALTTIGLQIAGTTRLTVNSTTVALGTGIALSLAGAVVAASGNIRAANNTTILAIRNAANSADVSILTSDSANNIVFGENTNTPGAYIRAAAACVLAVAGTTRLTATTTGVDLVGAITGTSTAVFTGICTAASFKVGTGATDPTITFGTGAPATAPNNGSIYLRTDGTTATTLYVRAAGAWQALN